MSLERCLSRPGPRLRTPRQEEREIRIAAGRRRIPEAAVSVFARKGYFAARAADIAKKASVADGTI
jgi:AcrR family transcriptional regulator